MKTFIFKITYIGLVCIMTSCSLNSSNSYTQKQLDLTVKKQSVAIVSDEKRFIISEIPEGYYYPSKKIDINQYDFNSISLMEKNDVILCNLNLVEKSSGQEKEFSVTSVKLENDSLCLERNDSNVGNFKLAAKFIINPLQDDKVVEDETIVLEGIIFLNNKSEKIQFTFFAGD